MKHLARDVEKQDIYVEIGVCEQWRFGPTGWRFPPTLVRAAGGFRIPAAGHGRGIFRRSEGLQRR